MQHIEHNERENRAQREHVASLNRTIERWRTCAMFSILALSILVGLETVKIFQLRHEIASEKEQLFVMTTTKTVPLTYSDVISHWSVTAARFESIANELQDELENTQHSLSVSQSELAEYKARRAMLEPFIKSGQLAIVGGK